MLVERDDNDVSVDASDFTTLIDIDPIRGKRDVAKGGQGCR